MAEEHKLQFSEVNDLDIEYAERFRRGYGGRYDKEVQELANCFCEYRLISLGIISRGE